MNLIANRRAIPIRFFQVNTHLNELETLESELEKAVDNLQLVLTQVLISQNKKLRDELNEGHDEIRRENQHPHFGFFTPNKEHTSRPLEIDQPTVTLDEMAS